MIRLSLCSVILLLLAGILPASAQAHWEALKTFPIGGEGGWDYVTVDAPGHRLFVTRTTHTQAVDTVSGKVLADIPGQIRSHGVAVAPKLGRGFITDGGGSGAIVVFDTETYKVLGRIPAMPDADGILYDAKLDRVMAVSGDGNALMVFAPAIDPKDGKIDPPIDLGGEPEFLASDGTGKVYINLANKDLVAVVDLHTRKVIARWPVAPGGHPVGMAIDPARHLLFVGCRRPQKLIVMDTENGQVKAVLPIGSGNDAVGFSRGQVFASCRDGSLTVAGEKAGKFEVEQTVTTLEGARTMGLEQSSQEIFLPTAQLEPVAGERPKMKPDTFEILVVKGR
jgi:DNA-binding beta-propeller fold protein YncE